MSAIAGPITNLLLGIGNIAAGVGFGAAEKEKMDELNEKTKKLKASVGKSGNLYDHVYYLVAVNLKRVKKSLDKLPSDFLKKVQDKIMADMSDSEFEKAMKVVASVLNYAQMGTGALQSLAAIAIALRKRKADAGKEAESEPTPEPTEGSFEEVPLGGETPAPAAEEESSMAKSPKLDKFAKGLDIAGIVFGAAGLVTTIGLGAWTLVKLDNAISDVEEKQKQADAFMKGMTDALDPLLEDAGLPAKSYDELIGMSRTWKKISENFDSYEKSMYYAIRGYYMKKSFADIKVMVNKESDEGKPFPEDGYALAETLAGDVKYQFDQKKTDKEVVAFFATENPKIGFRFVFDEFFVSSLRWL